MLTAAYHMLNIGVVYEDLTESYFDGREKTKMTKRLVKRLHDLGYNAQLTPVVAA
jgi:hypothetical protein